MATDSEMDDIPAEDNILGDFHRLMIEALRQRESEIIQFIAILAAALAGFGWLAKAVSPDSATTTLSSGAFIIGTAGVLLLLAVGAVYAVALGYNFRYIIMQIAKLEAKWRLSQSRLAGWPKCPDDFINRYGCYCRPPEIIQVFWLAFLFAIVGVTLAAALLMPQTPVLVILIILGCVFSLVGWLAPRRYGKKIKKLAEAEADGSNWGPECAKKFQGNG